MFETFVFLLSGHAPKYVNTGVTHSYKLLKGPSTLLPINTHIHIFTTVIQRFCQLLRLYCVGDRWASKRIALVDWYWQGESEVLEADHFPVPLRPTQISYALAWNRTRAFVVRVLRQTSSVMARPLFICLHGLVVCKSLFWRYVIGNLSHRKGNEIQKK
jgi:hypothetical protein